MMMRHTGLFLSILKQATFTNIFRNPNKVESKLWDNAALTEIIEVSTAAHEVSHG